jgi:hypothetical protein
VLDDAATAVDTYDYDDLGNILLKSDLGFGYKYEMRPHAVTTIVKNDGTAARYAYSTVLVAGGIVRTAQGLVPYAGLIDLPNADPNFDLVRALGLGLGGAWTANQGAGLAAIGAGAAALGGAGVPFTLGGSLVLELPAGAAIAVGGAWAAGGVVNAVESGKLLSSMMRSSGDGGNAAPVGADGTAAGGGVGAAPRATEAASNVKFTKEMNSQAKIIAKGGDISKADKLTELYGGRTRDWSKMKTWTAGGQEVHYYQGPNGMKVGIKLADEADPF